MRRLLLFVFAVGLAVLSTPSVSVACSGTALVGEDTTDPDADVIFSGTAVRREDAALFRFGGNLFEPVRWTFIVDGVEKGSAERRVTIESEKHDAACGFQFRLGKRYRVVASDVGHGLQVWSGNGTAQLEPSGTPPAIEGDGIALLNPLFAVVVGGAALLALVVFVRRPGGAHGERQPPTGS